MYASLRNHSLISCTLLIVQGLENEIELADRRLPSMPLVLEYAANGKASRYNLRRLTEQSYHLVMAERFDDFYSMIAFNYEFLLAKVCGASYADLLEDLLFLWSVHENRRKDPEFQLLVNAIRVSALSLRQNPLSLPIDLIGRLQTFAKAPENTRLASLVKECQKVSL